LLAIAGVSGDALIIKAGIEGAGEGEGGRAVALIWAGGPLSPSTLPERGGPLLSAVLVGRKAFPPWIAANRAPRPTCGVVRGAGSVAGCGGATRGGGGGGGGAELSSPTAGLEVGLERWELEIWELQKVVDECSQTKP
jgi:hypothetical protein